MMELCCRVACTQRADWSGRCMEKNLYESPKTPAKGNRAGAERRPSVNPSMSHNQQQHAPIAAYNDMIVPLDLLWLVTGCSSQVMYVRLIWVCVFSQVVLAYESFKALKAAPPPRKRRNANKNGDADHEAVPRLSAYASNKRKRAMKIMLRAWLIYVRTTNAILPT